MPECDYCSQPASRPFELFGETKQLCETCIETRPWQQKPEPVLEPPVRDPFHEKDFYGG